MTLKYGLIEPIDVPLAALPPGLDGLRIAHLTDLHIRRATPRHRRLIDQLSRHRFDLACFTGDYMTRPGDEAAAFDAMQQLTARLRPRLGSFGIFGNHDTAELIDRLADLPVRWLVNQAVVVEGQPLEVWGLTGRRAVAPDSAALALDAAHLYSASTSTPANTASAASQVNNASSTSEPSHTPAEAHADTYAEASAEAPLRLMLSHHPDALPTAADLGVDLMLAGHTHGGQCRLPTGRALANASRFPLAMTSGLLRHRDTLALVSRGLGETHLPMRVCCPRHVPLYTLRRRTTPGRSTPEITSVWQW